MTKPKKASTQQQLQEEEDNSDFDYDDASDSDSFKKAGKWTEHEDDLLYHYVPIYGEKSWQKVAKHVPGRTSIQCLHRWTKILKPGLVKGAWTPEEDEVLQDWVKENGPTKWSQCAMNVEGRSGKQCRERWFNNLNPEVRKGGWSMDEDKLIFDLYQKYGSSWSKVAKYVPNRTENSIKNRFYSTLRKLASDRKKAANPHTLKKISFQNNSYLYELLDGSAQPVEEEVKEGEEPPVYKPRRGRRGAESNASDPRIPLNVRGQKYVVKTEVSNFTDGFSSSQKTSIFGSSGKKNQTTDQSYAVNTKIDQVFDMAYETADLDSFDKLQESILELCKENVNDLDHAFQKVPSSEKDSNTDPLAFTKDSKSPSFQKDDEIEKAKKEASGNHSINLRRSQRVQRRVQKEKEPAKSESGYQPRPLCPSLKKNVTSLFGSITKIIEDVYSKNKDFSNDVADLMLNLSSPSQVRNVDAKADYLYEQLDSIEAQLMNVRNELLQAEQTPSTAKPEESCQEDNFINQNFEETFTSLINYGQENSIEDDFMSGNNATTFGFSLENDGPFNFDFFDATSFDDCEGERIFKKLIA